MKLRIQDLPVAPAVVSTDLTIIERSNGVTYQTTAGQINGAGLSTANLSTALVTPTGAPIARTEGARANDWTNILDYRVAGTTDDIALAAAYNALPASGGTILMPASGAPYNFAAAVSLSGKPIILMGDGEAVTVINVIHLNVALTITQSNGANMTWLGKFKFVLMTAGASAGAVTINYTGTGETPTPAVRIIDLEAVAGVSGAVWNAGLTLSGGTSPPANLGVVQIGRLTVQCALTALPAPTGSYALVISGVNDLNIKDFVTTNCDAAIYQTSYCEGLRVQTLSCVSNNYFMKQNGSMTLGPGTPGGTLTMQKMWIHDGEIATYNGGFLVASVSETFLTDLDFVGLGGSNWTALGLTDCFGWLGTNIYIDGLLATGVPQGVHLTASGTTGQYCGDNAFPHLSTNRLSYSINIGSGCYYNFFDEAFCRSGVPGSSNPVNNVADSSGNATNRITFANSNGNLSTTKGYLQFDALDYSPGVRFTFGLGAVNYPILSNAGTGNAPGYGVAGSDASISVALAAKGSGLVVLENGYGIIAEVQGVAGAASANYPLISAVAAGSAVSYGVLGSDTNINLVLSPKGTGLVYAGAYPVLASQAVSASTTNSVTNKIKVVVGGTTYYLLASTSAT